MGLTPLVKYNLLINTVGRQWELVRTNVIPNESELRKLLSGYLFTAAHSPGRQLTHLMPEHESEMLGTSNYVQGVNDKVKSCMCLNKEKTR